MTVRYSRSPIAQLSAALVALSCGAGNGDPEQYELWSEGTSAFSTSLIVPIGNRRQKNCQATVISPNWAITAAHCFTGAPADGRARLEALEYGFGIDEVEVHRLAHRSLSTRVGSDWVNADIRAEHDLALIPLRAEAPASASAAWQPECASPESVGLAVSFSAQRGGVALTGHGQTLGHVDASSLLGGEQTGTLLSVIGARPTPGDSGSGLVAGTGSLPQLLWECFDGAMQGAAEAAVVAIVQNSPAAESTLPFGAVPLYTAEHAAWLQSFLEQQPQSGEEQDASD